MIVDTYHVSCSKAFYSVAFTLYSEEISRLKAFLKEEKENWLKVGIQCFEWMMFEKHNLGNFIKLDDLKTQSVCMWERERETEIEREGEKNEKDRDCQRESKRETELASSRHFYVFSNLSSVSLEQLLFFLCIFFIYLEFLLNLPWE